MNTSNTSKSNDLQGAFPVIKIDYQHRLVKTNTIAQPLITSWNCREGGKLPLQLLSQHPSLHASFKNPVPTECIISFGDLNIWFDVIPFPEAGYVGLYGYHVESLAPEKASQNLRMAG